MASATAAPVIGGVGAAHATTPTPMLSVFAGVIGSTGDETPGPATASELRGPWSVAVDDHDNVIIGDVGNGWIDRVTPSGTLSVLSTEPCEPYGAAPTPNGHIVVADDCAFGLWDLSPATNPWTRTQAPHTASYDEPTGVVADDAGNLYFDFAYSTPWSILKLTPLGAVSTVAGNGTSGATIQGPATATHLQQPQQMAIDTTGDIYVADAGNNTIDKITPAGTLSFVAGNVGGTTPATQYALSDPYGVAVDSVGNVYIADSGHHTVLRVTPAGAIHTVAGTGTSGAPTTGPPLASALNTPTTLALDSSGALYIDDNDWNTQALIEKVSNIAVPSAPTPGAPRMDGRSVVLPWTPITGATEYSITIYVDGVATSTVAHLTGTSYTIANPIAGKTYSFTVSAANGAGTGAMSARSSSLTVAAAGYWELAADGGVFSFGSRFYGSTVGLRLNQPIVAMAATNGGTGYDLVARDGGIFSFGTATFHGSLAVALRHDVVAMSVDRATGGYWILTSDGGVFSYDAPFLGSAAASGMTDFVGMAVTPDSRGYYLARADGTVYAFGDAHLQGDAHTIAHAVAPIVGIAVDASTGGYWEADTRGGVFAFAARFHGAATLVPGEQVTGIAAANNGTGYRLAGNDGAIYSFNAPFLGSMARQPLNAPTLGLADEN